MVDTANRSEAVGNPVRGLDQFGFIIVAAVAEIMSETGTETGPFEFDPEVVDQVDALAEAFVLEEFDAELLNDLDQAYLQRLVDLGETHGDTLDTDPEFGAAVQVAELVLERLEAAEQRSEPAINGLPHQR